MINDSSKNLDETMKSNSNETHSRLVLSWEIKKKELVQRTISLLFLIE